MLCVRMTYLELNCRRLRLRATGVIGDSLEALLVIGIY